MLLTESNWILEAWIRISPLPQDSICNQLNWNKTIFSTRGKILLITDYLIIIFVNSEKKWIDH